MIGQPCPLHPSLPLAGACDRCGDFGCAQCLPNGRTCLNCVPHWNVEKPDISKTFAEVFQDPRWGWKAAGGALCLLTSFFFIPMFILMGYHARIARQQRERPRPGLPEWDGLGSLAWEGFKSYLAVSLPMIVLYMGLGIGMGVLMLVVAPPGSKPPAQPPPAFVIGMVGMVVAFYAAIFAYALVMPVVQVQYMRSGSVVSAFHFRALWKIVRDHPVDYLIFFVITVVLYFVSTIVGELMCLVGLFFTMPLGLYIQGHYLGRYVAWLDAAETRG